MHSWVERILLGEKTVEVRPKRIDAHVGKRIRFAVIGKSVLAGSVGSLVGCVGPLSEEEWISSRTRHWVEGQRSYGGKTYGWLLAEPHRYALPLRFKPKQGAQTWQLS